MTSGFSLLTGDRKVDAAAAASVSVRAIYNENYDLGIKVKSLFDQPSNIAGNCDVHIRLQRGTLWRLYLLWPPVLSQRSPGKNTSSHHPKCT